MRILLTGAAGNIGQTFFAAKKDDYQFRLTDVAPFPYSIGQHDAQIGDLRELDFVSSLVTGVDVIVHLAGIPDPELDYESVMAANVEPTRHLLNAAVTADVKRFVFASSAQTVEGYAVDVQVRTSDHIRPANAYGVGKVVGEALCAFYAFKYELETVSLRIGAFEDPARDQLSNARDMSAWLSPRDATNLIDRAITADIDSPLIVNGISNNRFKRLDLQSARMAIGYSPVDDAFANFAPPPKNIR